MKKLLLFIIVALVLLLPLTSAYVCKDVTEIQNLPCEVITPIINCSNYIYNLTNLTNGNNSLLITDGELSAIGDGTYNFSFNQTYGSYSIVLCNSNSATIDVIPEIEQTTWYGVLFMILIAIPILLFILSLKTGDLTFRTMSGFLFIIYGVGIYTTGYPILEDSFLQSILPLVLLGLGFIILLVTAVNYFKGVD